MTRTRRWLLVVCHFVCPLVFFTNLTRNPYITQISLLGAGLALALAAWVLRETSRPESSWPRVPAAWPLAAFLLVWGASWTRAYFVHPEFFRPSLAAEGGRAAAFWLINAVAPFLLAAGLASEEDGPSETPLSGWVVFSLVWGLLWTAYPQLRSRGTGRPDDLWGLIWDPYAAFLWATGLGATIWLTRRGRVADFLHLAFCAGFLASAYGVLQYFNFEFVWAHALNPYGGRAVSTFGNPNFLSSYNVILMPCALALFVAEKGTGRRLVYGALFLTLEGALLATLTRSSWLGAAVSCAALAASPRLRARLRDDPRPVGLVLGAGLLMALFWPSSSIASGYTPSVIGRLTEMKEIMAKEGSYSPMHQRFLIWSCAWLMGSESPLLGKGGGAFELFYPFYQGVMLHSIDFFRNMRTHANNSHNEILEIFSQTGLLGLGAYAWLWATFFETARRRLAGRAAEDPLWIGCAAGCAGMLADNLLNVSLHFAVPAFLFWWAAGTVMGKDARRSAAVAGPWNGVPARRALAAAAVVFALGACWLQARVWLRETRYFAGFKYVRQGNLAGAIKELERSRAWGPREVNAIYELGNAYARAGLPSDAADAYRAALSANAGYDEIYFNLATVLNTQLGRPDEALTLYRTAWAMNPLSPDIANGLISSYLRDPARWGGQAREVLEGTARRFPEQPNHWNNLGYLYALERRWPEAENAYSRALQAEPGFVTAERNLAALARQSGRPRAAILAALEELRGVEASAARGDWSEAALARADRLVVRFPAMPRALYLRGTLRLARGRAAEAAADLEAASSREPSRAGVRINLGTAYLALGRSADAAAQFRTALTLEPGNPQARQRLASMGLAP